MSIWGLYCVWHSDFLVPLLGGQKGFNAIMLGIQQYPRLDDQLVARGTLIYYLVQIGYRIEAVYYLVKQNSEPKYWEYLLHHLLAAQLVIYSYEVSLIGMGIQVIITHDLTDSVM